MGVRIFLAENEPLGLAIKRFTKLLQRHGVTHEVRRRGYFVKPTEQRRRKLPEKIQGAESDTSGEGSRRTADKVRTEVRERVLEDNRQAVGVTMAQTITATFENGVLKPTQPLDLPEHAQVRVTIEIVKMDIQKEWDATKEVRLIALENSLRLAKPLGEHLTRDQLHERR